jgi:phosphatidylinositol alpha-mannosyltransferase
MALGKPVCGFSNMGYKELLQDTKGEEFLAEPKNEIELAEKLDKLVSNEKLRKEMGEWGLKEVQKYSWEKVADRVLEFYKECNEIDAKTKG